MKSPQERLNDQIEQLMSSSRSGEALKSGFLLPSDTEDFEIRPLTRVAQQFQDTPQLQVDPAFANLLERRLLRQHLQRKTVHPWSFLQYLRLHSVLATVLSLCFVLLLCGTGVLAIAAHTTDTNNPFYPVKELVQHIQLTLAQAPTPTSSPLSLSKSTPTLTPNQIVPNIQSARDDLTILANLTSQADTNQYLSTLSSFDRAFTNAYRAIQTLPASPHQTQLAGELSTLEHDASQQFHKLLPQLTIDERSVTTTELGRLGENIPLLTSATLTLPNHPHQSAIISIVGSGIQPSAQLLVDGTNIHVTGTMNNGQLVFVLNLPGNQHPQSLGILNPDSTVGQTNKILFKSPGQNGNHNGQGGDNENGNGEPTKTPTPRHS